MTTRNAASTTENSVLFALRELSALESDRIEREQRAVAEQRAAEAAALKARAEAEAARVAAEESERQAQLRSAALEAEAKAKAELERDQRIAAMRAELSMIQGERAQLRAELVSRAMPAEPPRRSYGLAFGLSSVVAAGLAGLLVMQAQARPMAMPVERAPVAAVEHAAPAAVIEAPAPALAEAPAPEPEPVVAPVRRTHRHDVDRTEVRGDRERDERHELDTALDFGDDEGLLPGDAHRSR